MGRTEFEPGDVFLLCTDGLTHQLEVGAIRAIVAEERLSLAGRCDLLVRAANEGVGEENVTAVLVRAWDTLLRAVFDPPVSRISATRATP